MTNLWKMSTETEELKVISRQLEKCHTPSSQRVFIDYNKGIQTKFQNYVHRKKSYQT